MNELTYRDPFKNPNDNCSINRIIVSSASKDAIKNDEYLLTTILGIELITNQQPSPTFMRRSIAGFNVREGEPIGCKVTLRKSRMKAFLHMLLMDALPRIPDFSGISKSQFDDNCQLHFGIKDPVSAFSILSPHYDLFQRLGKGSVGLQITIDVNASNKDRAFNYLRSLGFPVVD